MAIVKMSKFDLFAFDSERENLLHELQKFKYVHFLNLNEDESLKEYGLRSVEVPENIVALDEEISKVKYGIETLSKYVPKESGFDAMKKGLETLSFDELEAKALKIDYENVYLQIKDLDSKKDALLQEVVRLNAAIDDLKPWTKLNSPIRDLNKFEQCEVLLGTIPKKLKQKLETDLLDTQYTYFEILSEDKDNLYIIALTSKLEVDQLKEILRNNSFSNAKLIGEDEPSNEISRLEEQINIKQNEINIYDDKIKQLSDTLPDLKVEYEYLMNKKLRLMASEKFMSTDNINVIQGYIPTDMEEDFLKSINSALKSKYYIEINEADKDDPDVPILLRNSKFAQSFESLTGMYALPRYNEIDPTPFLAPFYLAFFGMMIADIGYGVLMLIGTLVALKAFNLSESMKNSMRFFHYLSYSTIVWGVIYGSFLGGIVPLPALINPAVQYNELLVISIAFGAIHLFYGLGLKAYLSIRDGKVLDALFDVGFWYMALVGGIVFLASMVISVPNIVKNIAMIVMIIGMVGIVATGGRDAKSIPGKAAGGLYSLYGISSYVGDFVSYSRLMALGLSGGFIASAINMMIDMLFAKGIFGILAGIIVFFVGQLFNLFLSILSAYVHTIRLTYVEFFGKFYEGGGKAFNLFTNKTKYINLK
jgi:V/A-type H+-transporting ATPase subunit I